MEHWLILQAHKKNTQNKTHKKMTVETGFSCSILFHFFFKFQGFPYSFVRFFSLFDTRFKSKLNLYPDDDHFALSIAPDVERRLIVKALK